MTKLKCPFCQQELKPQTMDGEWLECWNCSYNEPSNIPFPQRILCGTKELWERLIYFANEVDLAVEAQIERTKELDHTRKALDVAVDALKSAHDYYEHCVKTDYDGDDVNWDCTALNMELDISKALEQINEITKGNK